MKIPKNLQVYFSSLIILLISGWSQAQPNGDCETITFQERVTVNSNQLIQCSVVPLGNDLAVSFRTSSDNFGLGRMNPDGSYDWLKTFEFNVDVRPTDLITTNDGGIVVLGAGRERHFVLRTDEDGNTLWTRELSELSDNEGFSIQETSDRGFLIVGTTSFSFDEIFAHIIKLREDGTLEWSRRLGYITPPPAFRRLSLKEVIPGLDGGYLIAANSGGGFDQEAQLVLLKISFGGSLEWARLYDKLISTGSISMANNPAGDGYYLCLSEGFIPDSDVGMMEIDLDGNFRRYRSFGGNGLDRSSHMQLLPDGNIMIGGVAAGGTLSDEALFLMLLDESWNILNLQGYGDPVSRELTNFNFGKSFALQDQSVFMVGHYLLGTPFTSIYIVRTDLDLNANCLEAPAVFESIDGNFSSTPLDLSVVLDQASSLLYTVQASDLSFQIIESCRERTGTNPIFTSETQEYCSGDTVIINGQLLTDSEILEDVFPAANGCDSTHRITVTFSDSIFTTENLTACLGDTLIVFGNEVTMDMDLEEIFPSANGCDSIRRVRVRFADAIRTSENIAACEGDTLLIFGTTVTTSIDLEEMYLGANGCDSTHRILVRFADTILTTENLVACSGDTLLVFGNVVTTDVDLEESYLGNNGCDSTHQVRVRFRDTVRTTENLVACSGDTLLVFGNVVTADADLEESYFGNNGCDSTHQVSVRFRDTIFTTENLNACTGDTLLVFGNEVTMDMNLEESYQAANGCDSTHQVMVRFNNPIITMENLTACSGDTLLIFGNEVTMDMNLEENYQAANGCDSTHQVMVRFNDPIITMENLTACIGDTLLVFSNEVTMDMDLEESYLAANGCDSTHQVMVRFNDPIITMENLTACTGDTLLIFGNEVTMDMNLEESYLGANGCDSTHQVMVRFDDPIITMESLTACSGDTLLVFGNEVTMDMDLEESYLAANGCDSTHQVIVRFENPIITSEDIAACGGDTVLVFGNPVTTDANLAETYLAANGCDSTHQVRVRFTPRIITSENLQACEGDTLLVFGLPVFEDNLLSQRYPSAVFCDSIHQVFVRFIAPLRTSEELQGCTGDTLLIFGNPVSEDQVLEETFTTSNGCDSIHQVNVVFADPVNTVSERNPCAGETIFIQGVPVTEDQVFLEILISSAGCDSIHQTLVRFQTPIETQENVEACAGDTLQINGQVITNDQVIEQVFPASTGCDSTHRIEVQFNPIFFTEENLIACEGDTVNLYGQSYTTNQIIEEIFVASNDCDSTHRINLSFLPSVFTQEEIEICPGDTVDVFGVPVFGETVQSQTFPAFNTCDSTHQIIVFVSPQIERYLNDTICAGDSLRFFDQVIGAAGTYLHEGKTETNPCATLYFLTVEVIPSPDLATASDTFYYGPQTIRLPELSRDESLSYEWSSENNPLSCVNCPRPYVELLENDFFELEVTGENGCTRATSFTAEVRAEGDIYIPNVFSPNGDGFNDYFTIFADARVSQVEVLQIFDRWGALVFENRNFLPNEPSLGWDGTHRGRRLNPGVYVYQVSLALEGGERRQRSGDILVLR